MSPHNIDGKNELTKLYSATVANGQLPGPLISGNMGDNFQLNVIDDLSDSTMYRSTSIVIIPTRSVLLLHTDHLYSTGMACSRMERKIWTVLQW